MSYVSLVINFISCHYLRFGSAFAVVLAGVLFFQFYDHSFGTKEIVKFTQELSAMKSKELRPYYASNYISSFLPDFPEQSVISQEQVTSTYKFIEVPSNFDYEALKATEVAIEMLNDGKIAKAQKLFEHALAISPEHPDILNHYGEFLESIHNDVIYADQMYFKAMIHSPGHSRAVQNHDRISSLVEELDRVTLERIDDKKALVQSIPEADVALKKAKLEAYYQHIYHTVGIKGNTMSLSETRSVVETRRPVKGKSIDEHNEILGLDAALKYINITLINRVGHITINDILEIHKRVMGHIDPIGAGKFRTTGVFVVKRMPPDPTDVPLLMKQFETWVNSCLLHPVKYAALAHYKLVHLHPFDDGNGRTSRLLMNTILMQAGFPPAIILKEDRHRYYKALELANEGDVRPFFRFIAECTEQTLDLFIWSTSRFPNQQDVLPALASKIIQIKSFNKHIIP